MIQFLAYVWLGLVLGVSFGNADQAQGQVLDPAGGFGCGSHNVPRLRETRVGLERGPGGDHGSGP